MRIFHGYFSLQEGNIIRHCPVNEPLCVQPPSEDIAERREVVEKVLQEMLGQNW